MNCAQITALSVVEYAGALTLTTVPIAASGMPIRTTSGIPISGISSDNRFRSRHAEFSDAVRAAASNASGGGREGFAIVATPNGGGDDGGDGGGGVLGGGSTPSGIARGTVVS